MRPDRSRCTPGTRAKRCESKYMTRVGSWRGYRHRMVEDVACVSWTRSRPVGGACPPTATAKSPGSKWHQPEPHPGPGQSVKARVSRATHTSDGHDGYLDRDSQGV